MTVKRIILSGDPVPTVTPTAIDPVDHILTEIASLYRERFRAVYNGDQAALLEVEKKIAVLKSKLPAA